ncbi:MAG: NAD(P)-dependent glycerol-3-phosphate dehydrogenase [Candidatus Omnitrophica bacterium]|nr:NAD(P)-dependent glycerol-3-phosphate dehydrogenase [Candidatus Omnitrophota bacterium]
MNIAVLGDGGWGTTLAILLNNKGYNLTLWSAFADYALYLDKKRENKKFLPGIRIPENIKITSNLEEALLGKEIVIFAIPSIYLRSVLKEIKKYKITKSIFVSATKGIERKTLMRMSEVIKDELKNIKLSVLSGPTIAQEVARGVPTTAVIASFDKKMNSFLQEVFITERFRVYTNVDLIGVELGGSLKNVIAIACGIADGLGFGTNTKAAILTRGLVEITRLGVAMGANSKTFSGISGLGDMATTCMSCFSRNRYVGEEIGKGRCLKDILKKMAMVAEGVFTAESAYKLSLKYKIDMPITREVYFVLYKDKPPHVAVRDLMSRERKDEMTDD